MRAHGLVDRPSQDLDFATITPAPLAEVADALTSSYRAVGLDVETVRGTYVLGRLMVSDRESGQSCAVDLMKLPLQRPPITIEIWPVADLDDLVGMKVSAAQGRGLPRDLIDIASVADHYSFIELERLGRLFDEEFRLEGLVARIELGMSLDEAHFRAYGLDEAAIHRVRRFLLAWYESLSMRLAEAGALAGDDPRPPGSGGP